MRDEIEKRAISRQAVVQVLKDYGRQYKKYPWHASVGFLLPAIGTTLIGFVPPLIVAEMVNIFVEQGGISLGTVGGYIVLYGALWLLGEAFWRMGIHMVIALEAKSMANLNRSTFKNLVARDYNFFANNFVGSLTKKTFAYVRNFESFTDTLLFNIVTYILPLIFTTVVLWRYSPVIPIVLFLFLGLVISIALPLLKVRSRLVALRHTAVSRLTGRLSDSVTNILAVKSFAREKEEQAEYEKYVKDTSGKFKRASDFQNLRIDIVLSPLYVAANVMGLVLAVFFTDKLSLEPGTIVVVFAYYAQITQIFWNINRIYRNIESSITEAAESAQLFLEPPSVLDTPNAKSLKVKNANISFTNVSFTYSGQKEGDGAGDGEKNSFLYDFSLDIGGKQKVGLVGPSGGGKTTITKILLRFIDLQSGSITIDGQNIHDVTQESLRDAISYVPQEPLLFHRSLFQNIAYGNEKATKADVARAARAAHADEFIEDLPDGYETLVGERGIKLSGGQRQRIAIARALLKDTSILVMDEATSSLDSESEKYIQEGLFELMRDKTAIVIAHRLSTVKSLDRIVVLDKGRIIQDGTHEELIKEEGIYSKLWSHQSGGL